MTEQYLKGHVAYGTFDDINKNLKDMSKEKTPKVHLWGFPYVRRHEQ